MRRLRRRAQVRLEAERILRRRGELAAVDLAMRLEKRLVYHLSAGTVSRLLQDHPRIVRDDRHNGPSTYLVRNPQEPRRVG